MKWRIIITKSKIVLGGLILLTALCLSGIIFLTLNKNKTNEDKNTAKIILTTISTLTPTPIPTLTITTTPVPSLTLSPVKNTSTKLIFGIGSQAGPAMEYRIVKEAPVKMLTSWYNGTKDLEWMSVQKNDLIPRLYAKGYVVHLVTWTDLPEETVQTPHGEACGRPYPVSSQVVDDMRQLAQIYNGPGLMYVTLFTEFQTFTCTDNNWNGNENYWLTLKDNFRKIKDIFHAEAAQSKVAISWGGWSSTYDDPVNQGGRSLFSHFADILSESDFTAFQSMDSSSNIQQILDMTSILGAYGKPVMLAHYKPANGSYEVFNNDMNKLFTDEIINQLI